MALRLNVSEPRSPSTCRPAPLAGLGRYDESGGGRLPSWTRALVLVSAVSLGSPAAGLAHEPGTTQVIASFTADRRYAIELTTDASTLLARLELARKQPRSSPATIADYRRGFAAVCDEIGRHLDASFDGTQVLVAPTCTVDDAVSGPDPSVASLGVAVRFDGPIPAGARRFTWQYGLTYTTYMLTIASSDGRADETMWLEGGEVSRAAELDRVAAPVGVRTPSSDISDSDSRTSFPGASLTFFSCWASSCSAVVCGPSCGSSARSAWHIPSRSA